ncbi:GATA transcription factor 16 [Perilla frutescens var. hirtella]|uniref:GATA transcription factor 16 n=1 Tax=Perilla frutescens var. hirtella TaxID=608512 RepID=A0AAD4P2Y5_PERFH|nr:GATA transcription factor 16 [Perilla frutescens var. hirtella]
MDNGKGKRASNFDGDDDEINKIDLTLKLGPSVNYNQNQAAEDDATSRGVHGFSTTGDWNAEYGGSSPAAPYNWTREAGGSTNYLVYHPLGHGPFPYNNVTAPNRKRPVVDNNKSCKVCGSINTPLWRKGPDGPQTLCNACGLRHLRTLKRGGE